MITRRELTRQDAREAVGTYVSRLSLLKSSTIVVTGGAGFLGSWIAELIACLNDDYAFGCQLTLIDRDCNDFFASRGHLAERADITLIQGDVRAIRDLPKGVEWIVHAAGTPDSRVHASNPVETMTAIGEGTANMLQLASRCSDLHMLLYVSSALVCGAQPLNLPELPESFCGVIPPIAPASAYSEAKRYGEVLCAAARSQSHIPVVCARPFAFVGPYQSLDAPWALNNFLQDALNGQPIRVLGNGETVRSYLYGADFALWILAILCQGKTGQIFNVGSPVAVSLREVATLVAQTMQSNLEIKFGGPTLSPHKVSRLVPSMENPVKELGLAVNTPLKTALERTILWHRSA